MGGVFTRRRELGLTTAWTWTGAPLPEARQHHWRLVCRAAGLEGHVDAPFMGDPPPRPDEVERLWDFEVAELFLAGPSGAYTELELSPHGYSLLLRFVAPRIRRPENGPLGIAAPSFERRGARWSARFLLPWALVPEDMDRACSFGLSGAGPERLYVVAAKLPGDVPDFHQPAHFPRMPLGFMRST